MKKNIMNKQSEILQKGGKISKEALKKVVTKLNSKKQTAGTKKGEEKKVLPDHHFKAVKVKRGMAGLGLFAEEDIKKGELIIEYIGNILNKEEAANVKTNQYLFEVNRNKTIDGQVRWNIARYCNHACEEACNAESEIKKKRVFVQALKNIKKGDEILYDYGEEFVKEYIAPYGCNCKAKKHSYGVKSKEEVEKEKKLVDSKSK